MFSLEGNYPVAALAAEVRLTPLLLPPTVSSIPSSPWVIHSCYNAPGGRASIPRLSDDFTKASLKQQWKVASWNNPAGNSTHDGGKS